MRSQASASGLRRLTIAGLLALAELLAIVAFYQLFASIECRLTEAELACRALRSFTARGFAVIAILVVFFRIRPTSFHHLRDMLSSAPGPARWLWLHFVGVALIFLPLALFGADQMNQAILPSLGLMLIGAITAAVGLLLWLTTWRNWGAWLKSDRFHLPVTLIGAALVPDLAEAIRPLWYQTSFSQLTYMLVFQTLTFFGTDILIDPKIFVIGLEGFNVQVGHQCAGVEGMALIAIFMALYALLMREDLRQKRYWLVLFPLALLASYVFNILRIATLILIGARISAEHALNGFHSYAGWLLFTCLALAIIAVAHGIRWFHKTPTDLADNANLRNDPVVAQILPFIVMMLSGVVAAVIWGDPDTGYPMRVAAMAAVLLMFAGYLKGLNWAVDLLAIAVGAVVGVVWLITGDSALGVGKEAPSAGWIALRIVGTVALVPLIEELFFRGYLLRRLDWGGLPSRIAAVAISSALFGLMHDRLLAGTAAGLVFALIYLKRDRLSDAIGAHVTANAVIALWALVQSDWTLI